MSKAWKWPVPGFSYISSNYGYRTPPTPGASSDHKGIDIAGEGILGAAIIAVCDGTVKYSGSASGYGNMIQINHGDGVVSEYGHMYTLNVSSGQSVKTGDVIAYVGNAGTSTGPHLHFQVNVNGTPVNPNNYVSYSSDTIPPSDPNVLSYNTLGEDEEDHWRKIPITQMYSIDKSGVTIGQRVSGLADQPIHAFVNIYVGDEMKLLSTDPPKPNIVQSFEITRVENEATETLITLFDDNWEELEEILSKNFDRIYVQYGYPNTSMKSKLYKLTLTGYSLEFIDTGTIIHVTASVGTATDNLSPMSIPLDTYNPTEAVKKICESLGYIVKDENFDESKDIQADNPFNLVEDLPISYITHVIIPQASQEGEELFSFDVDSDNVAYFKRQNSLINSSTENYRTYIYGKGYDSSVLSIEFDIRGTYGGVGQTEVVTGFKSSVIGTDNKEEYNYDINKSKALTYATGNVTHTKSTQSVVVTDNAGYTQRQASNKLYYYMKDMVNGAYECTMKIVGDPTIELADWIRIINVTDKGSLHHTSGLYMVLEVTDSIENGDMITALKLMRDATYNIDGVEILNPKYLVK